MPDLVELSRALTPPPGYRPPDLFEELYPYQQAANAQDSLRRHMLLAHSPGTGKTPMALSFIKPNDAVLIVSPPGIARQWAKRIDEWMSWEVPVLDKGVKVQSITPGRSAIIPDSLISQLPSYARFNTLIIDEVHRMKGRDTQRTLATLGGIKRGKRQFGVRAERVIALTGTPLQNSPVDLYPLLSVCAPHIAPSFEEYTNRYCPPVEMRVKHSPFPIKRYDLKMQNLEELSHHLRATIMIRPSADACRAQLPELIEDELFLPDVKDPADDSLDEETLAQVFDGHSMPSDVERHIAAVRRQTGMAKATSGALRAYLAELLEGSERPVIWCWHREVAEHLAALTSGGLIHGGIPMAAREDVKNRYINGELNALVMTIQAAGTGLDGLQASGSLAIFVERNSIPADNEQAVARLHRLGQTRGVRIVNIRAHTKVDRSIEAAISRRGNAIQKVMS